MKNNHLIGGTGPSFTMGWESALDACVDAISTLKAPNVFAVDKALAKASPIPPSGMTEGDERG